MDAAPYFAPTYFAPAYFGEATDPDPVSRVIPPYYAPTYFPPSYFYSATAPATAPQAIPPYYAPTYFPPSYFYGATAPATAPPVVPVPVPVPVPKGRDRVPYAALLALLRDSGAFESVIFGSALQRGQVGADGYPLAILTPKGWEESDDFDPALYVRRVSFSVTIVIKSPDADLQFDELDRLASAVQEVVNRSDLGGTSLAALTRIGAGRYGTAGHYPEQSIELEGGFATLVDPLAYPSATNN